MNNNDILIRLRYALDIKDIDMVEIFKLGGINVTKEDVLAMLIPSEKDNDELTDTDDTLGSEGSLKCTNIMLESFLNGFIIFKRGKRVLKPGESEKPVLSITNNKNVNNVMLKKLKIALALSGHDMIEILQSAGVTLSNSELSAVFRKEGQKNYKECGDRYARNFLKGLAIRYR